MTIEDLRTWAEQQMRDFKERTDEYQRAATIIAVLNVNARNQAAKQ